jgi:hypothetical protein
MGVHPKKKVIIILLLLLVPLALGRAQTAKKGEPHWESNLSLGYTNYLAVENPPTGWVDDMSRHIGIIKSFWYYPFLPRVLALGLSFDYVIDDLPLSLNASLNLPWKIFVPFVSAGAGFSFSGNTLQNYGGGLKIRTGKRFGLIAEYRHYRINKKSQGVVPGDEIVHLIRKSNYFGLGIAYLY